MTLWSRVKDHGLAVVRRGPTQVVWTPEFMGLGNLLYLALWVAEDPASRTMLRTPAVERWLTAFPRLLRLTSRRDDVPFTALRRSAISQSYGRFGSDFSGEALALFIQEYLVGPEARRPQDRVVLNIRRGDYFADPSVRGYFGFDQDAYLRIAVDRMQRREPIASVLVVSDGMDWCRARLGWLHEFANVEYSETESPEADFWDVATSRRVVMTNSTFSYWAGYVHDVLGSGQPEDVWAPSFFSRWQEDRSSWGLDPRWSVIEEIPGGWDS